MENCSLPSANCCQGNVTSIKATFCCMPCMRLVDRVAWMDGWMNEWMGCPRYKLLLVACVDQLIRWDDLSNSMVVIHLHLFPGGCYLPTLFSVTFDLPTWRCCVSIKWLLALPIDSHPAVHVVDGGLRLALRHWPFRSKYNIVRYV